MLLCGMIIQSEEDRSTIESLYHNYHRLMLYIAKGILNDQEKAEDAVSLTFLKIIDNLQKFSFKDCNKTKGLIVILVRNICCDMLRLENRYSVIALDEAKWSHNMEDLPYEKLASEESYQTIVREISELSETSGSVLKLKYIYDYSDREIAELLNISQESARVRLHRAKTALLQKLTERGENHEQK
ncbi:RNA polymerase sigma factor [Faecalispora anaeroviscerum]|uniref:RNA polymerase sigma factor n=1 Tax=Faecalispora anaeroviscerum TaxID=2991836 RepID=UPI0024B8BCA9|nr:RNA polymerase sigma factor [Faecalispora anaeroviscerum]